MDGQFIVMIIALVVVALPAMIMHYMTVWRTMKTQTPDDERLVDDLWRTAQRLERRVEALESILDREAPRWRPRKHRLGRNLRDAKIAGVCAGVSDYFGWRLATVRLIAILATVFLFPAPMIVYAILAIFLPPAEPIATLYDTKDEPDFWRDFTVQPKVAYGELRHRFRAIESRIATIESAVTSQEFALCREFSELKGEP